MGKTLTTRVDDKGRLTLPAEVRDALKVKTGAVFFIRVEGNILLLAPGVNPLDTLTNETIEEFKRDVITR